MRFCCICVIHVSKMTRLISFLVGFAIFCCCDDLFVFAQDSSDPRIVTTENGQLRGEYVKTVNGKDAIQFYIPYAQAPLGFLRFNTPRRPRNWFGIKNVTAQPPMCVQTSSTGEVVGSEDCLYMKIVMLKKRCTVKRAVYMFVHGGHFLTGNMTSMCDGDLLVEKGIIVATAQYRLGCLGYLSTMDFNSYGNSGTKDVRMALQWLYNNIGYFYGDNRRITLGGYGSGASIVGHLLLHPTCHGMIYASIMQSGSPLSYCSLIKDPKTVAFAVGDQLGIDTNSTLELIFRMRMESAQKVEAACNAVGGMNVFLKNPLAGPLIGPVKEPYNAEAVLTDSPYEMVKKLKCAAVPMLVGHTSMEANFFSEIIKQYPTNYEDNPSALVPYDTNIVQDVVKNTTGSLINYRYFNYPKNTTYLSTIHFFSIISYVVPTQKWITFLAGRNRTYAYRFDYKSQLGGGDPSLPGVGHAEDLVYYCKLCKDRNATETDKEVRRKWVTLIVNFIKFKNPTYRNQGGLIDEGRFDATDKANNHTFLVINENGRFVMRKNNNKGDCDFWDFIYDSFGVKPFDTR